MNYSSISKNLIATIAAVTGIILLSGTSVQAQLTGFGANASAPDGQSVDNGTYTLNAGNCCTPSGYSTVSSGDLILGGGQSYDYGSAFADQKQSTGGFFQSTFTFQQATGGSANGFSFALENDPRGKNALDMDNSGYAGNGSPIETSVQLAFLPTSDSVGLLINGSTGALPAFSATGAATGINFHDPVSVSLTNLPGQQKLLLTLTGTADSLAGTGVYTALYNVNVATALGSSTGFVGFSSTQDDNGVTFSNFNYVVPEPSEIAYAVLGLGSLAALLLFRKRREA